MKDPTGLTTGQARLVFKPPKPQPAKKPPWQSALGARSAGLNDLYGAPKKALPKPTSVKPIPKAKPRAPLAPAAAPPQQQGGQPTFQDFLSGLLGGGGQEQARVQPSFEDWLSGFMGGGQEQPDYGAMFKSYLDPIFNEYTSQAGQLDQQSKAHTEAISSFTMQLADLLKGMGGDVYTPEFAAALGLEGQRESSFADSQSKGKLYDSTVGDALKNAPQLWQKILDENSSQGLSPSEKLSFFKEYQSEFAPEQGLSPSDMLSALSSYNSTYGTPYQHEKDAESRAQKASDTALKKQAADTLVQIKLSQLGITQAKNKNDYNLKAAQLKQSQWYKQATLAQRSAALKQIGAYRQASTNIAQQNANTSATRARVSALNSDRNYQLAVERVGISKANLQLKAAQLADKQKNGGFTKSQVLGLKKRAGQIAQQAFTGVKSTRRVPALDKDGKEIRKPNGQLVTESQTGVEKMSYQEAMQKMVSEGIPPSVAMGALNTFWKRAGFKQPWEDVGEGRPVLGAKQRQALLGFRGAKLPRKK